MSVKVVKTYGFLSVGVATLVKVLREEWRSVITILLRVPDLVSLFRCSVVSKRWRHLLGDPGFLGRRAWPDGNRPSLLGFFVQRNRISSSSRRKVSKLFPTRAPAFVPAPGSHLGPGRRFLTSFIRDGNGLLDDAKPLAARGGLLLLRISPRPGDKNSDLRLCVCNLFTGRRDLLTPLNAAFLDGKGVQGYALLTAADHGAGPHRAADGYSSFFQVLLLGVSREERQLHLIRFSSSVAGGRKWYSRNRVGTSAWRFTGKAQVGVELGLLGIESLSSVCVGEKSGTALALYHSEPQCAYMLDLQSGSATKMEGWTRAFNYMTAVPYEINWPLFFMLRLGLWP
ncbi:hypothetical protein HU200_005013 [Digitaria exilis]|uniref:F-box domain-containing protein n=1 Tax=Digitaria exilis TaxID=1010633 RepID=A0A835KUI1_9POAL|nr:hypothetical protein HU200_005013 [Digitaria exilis]